MSRKRRLISLMFALLICISVYGSNFAEELYIQTANMDPEQVAASPTDLRPASPTDLWPASPTDLRLASPTDLCPASPTDLRPASPTDLWLASPTDLWPTSPMDLWPASPTDLRSASLTDLWPASPTDLWPASPTDLWPASPTDLWPASPTDLWPASPTDLWPASPTDLWPASPTDLWPASPTDLWPATPTDLWIEASSDADSDPLAEEDINFLEPQIEQDFIGLKVGDVIQMGYYEQDGDLDNLREPIEWIVISVNRRKNVALLASVYALDSVSFGTAGKEDEYREPGLNWKNAAIRQWLNEEIYEKCFTKNEKARIRQATNITKDPSGRVTTKDYVFLLSQTETGRYFKTVEKLKCEPTPYALSKLSEDSTAITKDGTCRWWIRELAHAVKVNGKGEAVGVDHNEAGYVDGSKGMSTFIRKIGALTYEEDVALVRPAMWIRFDAGNE